MYSGNVYVRGSEKGIGRAIRVRADVQLNERNLIIYKVLLNDKRIFKNVNLHEKIIILFKKCSATKELDS